MMFVEMLLLSVIYALVFWLLAWSIASYLNPEEKP
jgi:hypothetical protein